MTLGSRMMMNASLVPVGARVADIGCDHGKLSVYLIEKKIATHVIASDVAEGPLKRAIKTVKHAGLNDSIELRLADGADGIMRDDLGRPEVDVIVMAGIGGMLALQMVEKNIDIYRDIDCFIIQAQSNLDVLRLKMEDFGFTMIDEDMVYEDGKFYTAIKYIYSSENMTHASYITYEEDRETAHEKLSEADALYGPLLISKSHPVLHEYLLKDRKGLEDILNGISDKDDVSVRTETRREDIVRRIELADVLLDREWR